MTSSLSNQPVSYQLRPYQQEAVTATIQHFRQTDEAAVIVLPTGAGKSLVIAELGKLANRRVLVLAHVKELVEQNHQKYESYGFTASIFAAGLNRKESSEKVTFGSVQSVARNLAAFESEYSLLVIDECHRVSLEENSEYQKIIHHLKTHNSALKVLGLTATPYRLDSGWAYQRHLPRKMVRTTEAAPFASCIFELPLHYMIKSGFLTPPRLLDAPIALYDFEQLRLSNGAQAYYGEEDLNRILQGAKRATARIIRQVIDLAIDRSGVMIFAATVKHAKEILTYLPPESSAVILGNMRPKARDSVIQAFKNKQIKYLVNVSVLTTGFDAPHVDLIAILRPTDSVGLYQQIIGRGLRLSPGKTDCLILDYAGNTHDLYQPDITTPKPDSDSVIVNISCPVCQYSNPFWGKTDSNGDVMEHFGRRCQGLIPAGSDSDNNLQQCDFRFRFKECGQCGAENDIAARQCHQCDHLLVDPDHKLKEALKLRDAKVIRCAGMTLHSLLNKDQEPRLKVIYHDEEGVELSETYGLTTKAQQGRFYHQFARQHLKRPEARFFPAHPDDVVAEQQRFRTPDFVIARKKGRIWVIRDRIFDYEGRYRRANELY